MRAGVHAAHAAIAFQAKMQVAFFISDVFDRAVLDAQTALIALFCGMQVKTDESHNEMVNEHYRFHQNSDYFSGVLRASFAGDDFGACRLYLFLIGFIQAFRYPFIEFHHPIAAKRQQPVVTHIISFPFQFSDYRS